MPSRDELVKQLAEQWVVKAQADLEAAQALATHEGGLWSIVAFHCQQAVEKYIKATLTTLQIEFGKTHDIAELLDRIAEQREELAEAVRSAEALTVYGVQVRYPGDAPEVDRVEAEQALDLARMVARLVENELAD